MTALEERYRLAEAAAEEQRRRRLRRQPAILAAVVNALVLATASTAVVDLRRLHTPGGTALRWTEAALFGACEDYLRYSVADATQDPRSREELCRELRAATADARDRAATIGLRLDAVREQGRAARATLTITRPGGAQTVTLALRRVDGQWRVLRDTAACTAVGCA